MSSKQLYFFFISCLLPAPQKQCTCTVFGWVWVQAGCHFDSTENLLVIPRTSTAPVWPCSGTTARVDRTKVPKGLKATTVRIMRC